MDGKLYKIPESLKNVAVYYDADKVRDAADDDRRALAAVTAAPQGLALQGTNGLYTTSGWWAAFGGEFMDDTGKCAADQRRRGRRHQFLARPQGSAGATVDPDYARSPTRSRPATPT